MASDVDNLKAARSSLIQALATEAAAQATNPRPNITVDGETVAWDQWRESTQRQIDGYTELIVKLEGPVLIRTRGRA